MFHSLFLKGDSNISFPIQWKKVVKELTAGKAIICHISSKKKGMKGTTFSTTALFLLFSQAAVHNVYKLIFYDQFFTRPC